jgi:hypothetical protein
VIDRWAQGDLRNLLRSDTPKYRGTLANSVDVADAPNTATQTQRGVTDRRAQAIAQQPPFSPPQDGDRCPTNMLVSCRAISTLKSFFGGLQRRRSCVCWW